MSGAPSYEDHDACLLHPFGCDGPVDHARDYAERGWRVLPIKPGEKRPPMKAWQDAATTDLETIDTWWTKRYPEHGVGIATGAGSGIWVLDIDVSNGKPGAETLAALEAEHGPLPRTATVRTGSGGQHLYWLLPEGFEVRNDAGKRLGPGLDVRGEGGQVVAPPTFHPTTGAAYEWDPDAGPEAITEAPTWLLELAATRAITEAPTWLLELATTKAARPGEGTPMPAPIPLRPLEEEPDKDAEPLPLAARSVSPLDDERPGDRFERETTWPQLLEADGWTRGPIVDNQEQWVRPGKDPREGISATVGGPGDPEGRWLYVHTTSLDWLAQGEHSRFDYFAQRHHAGDHSAAARALRAEQQPARPARLSSVSYAGDEWEEPVPLGGLDDKVPPFPLDALPPVVADYVSASAAALQTSPDLLAAMVLPTASACIAGRWEVRVGESWTEELALYVAAVAPPGSMKSEAHRIATAPLSQLEADLIAERVAEVEVLRAERRADELRQAALERDLAKAKPNEAREIRGELEELTRHLAQSPVPEVPSIYTTDATAEALEVRMAAMGGRYAWLSPEGGFFGAAAGRYKGQGAASNLDVFLKGYSGEDLKVVRLNRPPVLIRKAQLAVGIMAQPDVVTDALNDAGLRGRGLLDRFLIAWPDLERKAKSTRAPAIPQGLAAKYGALIRRLYEAGQAIDAGERREIRLEPEAMDHLDGFFEEVHAWQSLGGKLEPIAQWADKLGGNTARLAAVLALLADPDALSVNLEAAQRATRLATYFAEHTLRAYSRAGARADIAAAARCLAAIRAARPTDKAWRQWPEVVTQRDVHDAVRRTPGLEDAQQVGAALRVLADSHYLRKLEPPEGKPGRPSVQWEVNPATFAN